MLRLFSTDNPGAEHDYTGISFWNDRPPCLPLMDTDGRDCVLDHELISSCRDLIPEAHLQDALEEHEEGVAGKLFLPLALLPCHYASSAMPSHIRNRPGLLAEVPIIARSCELVDGSNPEAVKALMRVLESDFAIVLTELLQDAKVPPYQSEVCYGMLQPHITVTMLGDFDSTQEMVPSIRAKLTTTVGLFAQWPAEGKTLESFPTFREGLTAPTQRAIDMMQQFNMLRKRGAQT